MNKWQFWVDRGGTFTDVVRRNPDGQLSTLKLLSENPNQYQDAALEAIRQTFSVDSVEAIPTDKIDVVKMGTTVATNALLERKGERLALAITKGFKDALRIAYQARPDLFKLNIQLPEQLYKDVIEINERVLASGEVEQPLELSETTQQLQSLYDKGYKAIAIVLMHSYRFTEHEQAVAKIAKEIGFSQVSVSHEISPLIKLVGRGDTTVVDAYLSPILRRYVDQVAQFLPNVRLMFMQSNGGLTDAQTFQGKDSILSGPAGGIVGAVESSKHKGFDKIIGFDMGGTSTDVAHFNGEYERIYHAEKAGVRIRAPMMDIHTIAAGGGSILSFEDGRFQVGPESAGAYPGAACYKNGGPLTVTDANVLLGKVQAKHFPAIFGKNADESLDVDIVKDKFESLRVSIEKDTGKSFTIEQIAEGFLRIAVDNMAHAINKISVQRGYEIRDYTLCSFGGAGSQHACAVAEAIGIKSIFIHPLSGVLSAYGMGLADIRELKEKSVDVILDEDAFDKIEDDFQTLEQQARSSVELQIANEVLRSASRSLNLKYQGTDYALKVNISDDLSTKSSQSSTLDLIINDFEKNIANNLVL